MKNALIIFTSLILFACNKKTESNEVNLPYKKYENIQKSKPNKISYNAEVILLNNNLNTEKELTKILNNIFDSIRNKANEKPNFVDIKIYESEAHLNAKMGQWIAWLSMTKKDVEPAISFQIPKEIDNKKLAQNIDKNRRIEIWNKLINYEDKARKESQQKYPDRKDSDKKFELEDQLIIKYKKELLLEFNISNEDLDKITDEALNSNWPFPQ